METITGYATKPKVTLIFSLILMKFFLVSDRNLQHYKRFIKLKIRVIEDTFKREQCEKCDLSL